jgi:hypothetical protein
LGWGTISVPGVGPEAWVTVVAALIVPPAPQFAPGVKVLTWNAVVEEFRTK